MCQSNAFLCNEDFLLFTENADLVRCFQCGIGLKDWVKEDDVVAEHIRHSIDCDFLYQKFGKTEVQRLKVCKIIKARGTCSGETYIVGNIMTRSYIRLQTFICIFSYLKMNILFLKRHNMLHRIGHFDYANWVRCYDNEVLRDGQVNLYYIFMGQVAVIKIIEVLSPWFSSSDILHLISA